MTIAEIWQLLAHSDLQQPLLAIVVLMLSRFAPIPASYRPWFFFKTIAQAISQKVAKPDNGAQQQYLAGVLALLVFMVPFSMLLLAFDELSAWPEFFEAVLLYMALDWQFYANQLAQIDNSLSKQQLSLAKDQLQPLVLRKTSQLSEPGIAKAALDSLALRLGKHWFGVLFWYLVGGGITACCYRLLLEVQQQWNPKLTQLREFGFFTAMIEKMASFFPLMLNSMLLAAWVNIKDTLTFFRFSQDLQLSFSSRWLLSAWAAALQCSMAGPVYYNQQKTSRVRIGPERQPSNSHLKLALKLALQLQNIALLLVFGLLVLNMAAL